MRRPKVQGRETTARLRCALWGCMGGPAPQEAKYRGVQQQGQTARNRGGATPGRWGEVRPKATPSLTSMGKAGEAVKSGNYDPSRPGVVLRRSGLAPGRGVRGPTDNAEGAACAALSVLEKPIALPSPV
jgi:hypothetical protein